MVREVHQCMVLNNFYWAVWAVMMLQEADEVNPNAFNWDFLAGRCEMHETCVAKYGVGHI